MRRLYFYLLMAMVFAMASVPGWADPTPQASYLAFSSVNSDQVRVSFTRGGGTNRIILVSTTAFTVPGNLPADGGTWNSGDTPLDFSDQTNRSNFGDAWVVYNSATDAAGRSFTITGLDPGTTYYFTVLEYTGADINVNSATNNPRYTYTAPDPPNHDPATELSTTSFLAHWTAPSGNYDYFELEVAQGGTPLTAYNSTEVGDATTWPIDELTDNTTYTYRLRSRYGARASVWSDDGVLNSQIVKTMTSPSFTGTTPVCEEASETYQTADAYATYTWAAITGATVTAGGGAADQSVTVTWDDPGTHTISVDVIDNEGNTGTITYDVTVNPIPTASAGADQVVCYSSPDVTMAGVIGGGASNHLWTTDGDGSFDVPTALSPIYTPGAADLAAGTVTLTITTDDPAGPCGTATDDMVVTINPVATATANIDQTICSDETVTLAGSVGGAAATLTWTTDGDGTFDDATLGAAVYTPGAQDIIDGTVTLTITSNDPAGPCDAATDDMVVTINPIPTASAGADQVVCYSSPNVTLSGVIGGGASSLTWSTSDGDGTFDDANAAGAVYTPGAQDLIDGTVTLTITTDDPVGPCGTATDDMVVTINPVATATANIDQTICSDETVTLAGSVGGAAATLTWTTDGDGIFDDATLGAAVYTPGAQDIIDGTVTLTITSNDPAGPCDVATDDMVVTINPIPTASAGADQVVCYSSPDVTLAGVIGGGASTLTWTTSGDGTFDNDALAGAVYTPGAGDLAAGTVTLTITTDDPAGPCGTATDDMVVTINPVATVSAGIDQTICSNGTATMAGTFGGAAASATWSTDGTGTFSSATATNAVYTPSVADIADGSINLTYTTNDPAGPCGTVSDVMVLTINPIPTANAGADQTICETGTASVTGTIGGGAATSTWTTSGTGVFADASALNTTYTPSADDKTAGTVMLILTTNDPAGPCVQASDVMVLTINHVATASAGIDQTICASGMATMAGVIGGTAASLTWSTAGDGTFNDATAANAVYTPGAADILAGTVTLTITSNDPAGPCGAATDAMTLTIDPIATADAGADQEVCSDNAVVTLNGTIGGSATSQTWSTSGDGVFDNNTLEDPVYTPGANDITAGEVTLTLTTNDPAGVCGSVTDDLVITITPVATADAGLDQEVCSDNPVVTMAGVIGGSATTLTWSTSGDGSFNDATAADAIYTPGAADIAAGTVTLTLTTDNPAGACGVVTDDMVVTITPVATADAGADQEVCSDNAVVTLNGTIGGSATSQTWSTSGDGTFDDNTLEDPVYTPGANDITTGTVTLTLTTNDPAGACGSVADEMVVTITPVATADAGLDQEVCSDNPVVTLEGAIGGSASSSTWSTSGDGSFNDATLLGGVYTPGAADIAAGTVTLTLTTDNPAGACGVVTDEMVITITSVATADAGLDQEVCSDNPVVTMAGIIGGSAATLTWSTSGDGAFDDATLTNAVYTPGANDISAGTVTLTLTTNDPAGACGSVADEMVVTITPVATADAGLDQTICETAAATMAGVIGGSATSLTWSTSGDGAFDDATAAGAIYTPGAADIAAGTVTLTLTTDNPAGACGSVTDDMVLTISPLVTVNAGAGDEICATADATYTLSGSATDATTTTWTTSGTGTFDNANLLAATYTPSAADKAAGSVTLTLTATGAAGCDGSTVTDNMVLTINPLPVVTITGDNTACTGSGNPETYTTQAGMTGYTWTFPGLVAETHYHINAGGTVTDNTVTVYWMSAGTRSVAVNYTNANGCTAASDATKTITVYDSPAPVISGPVETCETSREVYSAQAGFSTYSWTVDGGTIIGSTTTRYLNVEWGTGVAGTVDLTVTSPNGCSTAAATMNVTINDLPVVEFEAHDTEVCEGETVTYTLTSSDFIGYTWTVTNGTVLAGGTVNDNFVTVLWPTAQMAGVQVWAMNDNGCENVANTYITISTPSVAGSVTVDNSTICYNGEANLTLSGNTGSIEWQYSTDDATWNTIPGETAATLATGAMTESWYFRAVVTNGGCPSANTASVLVTVLPETVAGTGAVTVNPVCFGTEFEFTHSGGSNYDIVFWMIDNGMGGEPIDAANAGEPFYASLAPGSYVIFPRFINVDCGVSIDGPSFDVTVNDNPADPIISGDLEVCYGESTALTVSNAVLGIDYRWYTVAVGGAPFATANSFTYDEYTTGTWYVEAYNSATGCISARTPVTVTVNPELVVNAGADDAICAGSSANLDATVSGGTAPYTYSWDNAGTLSDATIANPVATPVGTTTYTLTVTDAAGCTMTDDVVITVNPLPTAEIASDDIDNTICEGTEVTFTATPAGGQNYIFYVDGVEVQNGASDTYITSDLVDGATLTTLVTDGNGCEDISDPLVFSVASHPNVVIDTWENTVCINDNEVEVYVDTYDGDTPSYQWQMFDGMDWVDLPGETGSSLFYSVVGLTQFRVMADNGECPAEPSNVVAVNTYPIPVVGTAIISDGEICQGEEITLTHEGGSNFDEVEWYSDNDGYIGSGASITITPTINDGYWATVYDYNCYIEDYSDLVYVTVNPAPLAEATNDGPYCEGDLITLTATDAGVGATYSWSGPNGFTSTDMVPTILNAAEVNEGTYELTVTSAEGCVASCTTDVVVNAIPVASITADGPLTFCEGNTVTLTASAGESYFWSTGATTNSILVTTGGSYTVTVTNGTCSDESDPVDVTVNALPTATLAGTQNICEATSADLTVTFTGSGPFDLTYTDGITPVTLTGIVDNPYVFAVSPAATTTYSLTSVTDANCTAAIAGQTAEVTVDLPSIAVRPNEYFYDDRICQGEDQVWLFMDPGYRGTIQWQQNTGLGWEDIPGDNGFWHPMTQTTSFRTIVTNGACPAETSAVMTVDYILTPEAPTAANSDRDNICASDNGMITLTAVGGANGTYEWYSDAAGLNNIGTGVSISVESPAATQTYYVRVENVCSNSVMADVTVNITDVPTLVINNPAAVCESTLVDITAAGITAGSTLNGGALTYWTNAEATDELLTPTEVAVGGTYYIKAENSCGADIEAVTVTITALPDAAGAIAGDNDVLINETGVVYTVPAITGATGYTWTVPFGASIVAGDNTNSITVDYSNDAVSGNIEVFGTNDCGAGVSSTLAVTVSAPLAEEPTTQASDVVFSDVYSTRMTVNWTNGNGGKRIVLVHEGSPVDFTPVDGTDYPAQELGSVSLSGLDELGVGNYILYNGSGSGPVTLTGLTGGTTYYVEVFEYNDDLGRDNYKTDVEAAASQATGNAATKLVITSVTGNPVVSGTAFNVTIQTQDEAGNPAYPESDVNVSLTEDGTSSFVGTTSGTISSLNNQLVLSNLTYTLTLANTKLGEVDRTMTAAGGTLTSGTREFDVMPTQPGTQARSVVFGVATCSTLVISWTNGNGAGRMVVVRQGGTPTAPRDSVTYTANAEFGLGSTTGTGSYVVYRGAGNTVTITGLAPSTAYTYQVFEYNGTPAEDSTMNYLTATGSFNPRGRTQSACRTTDASSYVEVTGLNAKAQTDKVYLTWQSLVEQNNAGFELYRADESNNEEFNLVGSYAMNDELKGMTTNNSGQAYRFVDGNDIQIGQTYIYKLVSVGLDGSKEEQAETIVTVLDGNNAGILHVSDVAPNPVTDKVNFNVYLANEQNVTFEIMDMSGKTIYMSESRMSAGNQPMSIGLKNVASGSYILNVTVNGETVSQKFMYLP